MKTRLSKFLAIGASLLLCIVFVSGCWSSLVWSNIGQREFAPVINVTLSFSALPELNCEIRVKSEFSIPKDFRDYIPNVSIEIKIPDGFQIIEGDIARQCDFVKGQTYTLSATVKAIRTGTWIIAGVAQYRNGASIEGSGKDVYVIITDEGASIVDELS